MKVCYIVNQYPKVSHTFIRREIKALERQGIEVERVSIRRSADTLVDAEDQRELARTHVLLDAGVIGLLAALAARALRDPLRFARAAQLTMKIGWRSERGLLRNVAYLAEACLLRDRLGEKACDHVHAHFGTNPATVAMLCSVLGGPSYSFTVHGPEEFDKPLMLSLRDKIERAAFVVAISSFGRGQLYRHCGHQHWKKVHVVRCGLDPQLLRSEMAKLPTRPRVVCVGRLNEQKGHLLLVEAAARVAAAGDELELRLVGDGELRPEIEGLIARHGLRDRVHITGWASSEQVQAEIEAARIVVLASFAEGLPVVITEAMAVGRTVLTTSIAGIPELVSRDCGWLIPAGSVEALATGLRRALHASDTELERMGRRGQARVRRLHDADHEAAKLRRYFVRYAGAGATAGARAAAKATATHGKKAGARGASTRPVRVPSNAAPARRQNAAARSQGSLGLR